MSLPSGSIVGFCGRAFGNPGRYAPRIRRDEAHKQIPGSLLAGVREQQGSLGRTPRSEPAHCKCDLDTTRLLVQRLLCQRRLAPERRSGYRSRQDGHERRHQGLQRREAPAREARGARICVARRALGARGARGGGGRLRPRRPQPHQARGRRRCVCTGRGARGCGCPYRHSGPGGSPRERAGQPPLRARRHPVRLQRRRRCHPLDCGAGRGRQGGYQHRRPRCDFAPWFWDWA